MLAGGRQACLGTPVNRVEIPCHAKTHIASSKRALSGCSVSNCLVPGGSPTPHVARRITSTCGRSRMLKSRKALAVANNAGSKMTVAITGVGCLTFVWSKGCVHTAGGHAATPNCFTIMCKTPPTLTSDTCTDIASNSWIGLTLDWVCHVHTQHAHLLAPHCICDFCRTPWPAGECVHRNRHAKSHARFPKACM